MIDPELIIRKTVLIDRDLPALGDLAAKPREAFLKSLTDELLAERLLERIIGRMIDINYHLLTESGQAPPVDYHRSFLDLERLAVLDHEFALRIAACDGLRNRIVHEYNELDPAKIHEALQSAVRDIPVYLSKVNAFAERQRG